jgi:hypothetical protein
MSRFTFILGLQTSGLRRIDLDLPQSLLHPLFFSKVQQPTLNDKIVHNIRPGAIKTRCYKSTHPQSPDPDLIQLSPNNILFSETRLEQGARSR